MNAPVRNAKPAITVGKIEKKVPIPPHGNFGRAGKTGMIGARLKALELGDSFLVSGTPRASIFSAAKGPRKQGRNFVTRAVDGGVRVWRIA